MTPHINAKKEEIAKVVLMPGDPLRAKHIAEKYLKNVILVNSIRNMLFYTGDYKGKLVSICASGMGQPSIGIYSYELFKFYDVEKIIRIGSAGSYYEDLKVNDVFLVTSCYSDSNAFNLLVNESNENTIEPSSHLISTARQAAHDLKIEISEGRVHSSDVFYANRPIEVTKQVTQARCVEMESFALFVNAKHLNRHAACLLTISDSLITNETLSPAERQTSFEKMFELALEVARREA